MPQKKPAAKQIASSRLSLASRLIGSALRATVQVAPSEEPWKNMKLKGKNRNKKAK
jgi:hypothetical protein